MKSDKLKRYIFAFDIGSSSVKSIVYDYVQHKIIFVSQNYCDLHVDKLTAENDPEQWWQGIKHAIAHAKLEISDLMEQLSAITFCTQLQSLVLIDSQGKPLLNSMNYLDARAHAEFKNQFASGLLKIEGINLRKVLPFLYLTSGAPGSAKDPLWKYLWVKRERTEIFKKVYKWLDVKDYLIHRCTDQACTTEDAAHLTFLYNLRSKTPHWSEYLCRQYGVDMNHLPRVIKGHDVAGYLTAKAAKDLGLPQDLAVFGGGGDITCLGLGAGSAGLGKSHVYIGTSAWVGKTVDKKMLDINSYCASLKLSTGPNFNYMGELQTGGVCLKWGVRQLFSDTQENMQVESDEFPSEKHFELLQSLARHSPAGANGAIFLPWLLGSRSPKEDALARGAFYNLSLSSNRADLARSLYEGVALHLGWIAKAIDDKTSLPSITRFVGGGAQSPLWGQILADVLQVQVEVPHRPREAGALGAAMIALIGLGVIKDAAGIDELIPTAKTYVPKSEYSKLYRDRFEHYISIFSRNQKIFRGLNS